MADRSAALVPAAGRGDRLGLGPKAFLEVGGRPLLAWAVAALAPWVDEVVVAVPADGVDRARHALAACSLTAAAHVVVGGADRQATVRTLIQATSADLLLVHDAARPFLTAATVQAVLAATVAHGACSVAIDVADTLVRTADGATVDRSALKAVQTPQGFRRSLLERAHARALVDGIVATDDAGLVRRLGVTVAWVPGDAQLFKVTTAADLALAEAWAAAQAGAARDG
jgi:2-C-methyl-D-erythritol 4-phosphate cytidylyltransferase